MIRTVTKCYMITSALTTILLLSGANASAFMGMGGGSGSPHGGGTSTAEPQPRVKETITRHGSQSDTIVATVNEQPITMAQLMGNIQDIMRREYRGMEMTDDLARRIRYNALEELALEELAYQRARAIGALPAEEEIETRLDKTIAAAGGREQFRQRLADQDKELADIREEIRRFLAIKNTVEREVGDHIEVTDDEIEKLFRENREKFATPEKVTITDIVFFLDPEDKKARDKVQAVRRRLVEELDGDPGALDPDGFAVQSGINVSGNNKNEHYELAKEMEPGSISRPVIIDETLHLIKLDRYQPRKEADPEKVKAYLGRKVKKSKRQKQLSQWRRDLLSKADINIKHELLKEYSN